MLTAKIKATAFLTGGKSVGLQIKKMHKSGSAATAAAIDKALDAMFEKAVARQATDIHIEPRERNIVVRFRIDGLLSEIAKLPLPVLAGLSENLKTRAGLDTHESRTPQSGSFAFTSDQHDITVRIATMPTMNGEKISIHLSQQLSELATLESLGYWGDMLRHIEQAVTDQHGLIVVSSPNHIGTSLSLLGIVHLLNNSSLNIVTLEDRIEQQVSGVSQTQIDPSTGLGFGNGLQALLKQDPNVVMLSNLLERDTVVLSLQAAMSGRLILGGLHTNSAANAVAHLLHMGSESYLVAAALKLVAGQRFVRRLCPVCREAYEPDASLRKSLKQLLKTSGITSMRSLHELERKAAADNIGAGEQNSFGTTEAGIERLWRPHPDGCPHCHFSGFAGRVGVCEVLVNSDAMKRLIAKQPAAADIQKLAVAEGMLPMQCDALIKALRGLTSIEEALLLAK